jgi:hypothetical protein
MFIPPFCPRKNCLIHEKPPDFPWWERKGAYYTTCFGSVPRFKCIVCGRGFSTQTFSIDYYAKRLVNYQALEELVSSSMSVRALSRSFGRSCGTIANRTDRLARQSIALHATLRPRASRYESVCIDGFVGFDRSQFFPNNITLSITSKSRYALSFTHASLRRSGMMREDQKKRRDELYDGVCFEKKALERSFTELLDELERNRPPRAKAPLVVITDEKIEYERAFVAHRLFREQDEEHRVVHLRVSSKLPRTCWNPLFASNYLDREIRKDQAAHRRESTCFARNVANGLSRMACYLGWHNYKKRYLIKAPMGERQCHGEEAGIPGELIAEERRRLFEERVFLSRIRLNRVEEKLWKKLFPTPGYRTQPHLPAFALG